MRSSRSIGAASSSVREDSLLFRFGAFLKGLRDRRFDLVVDLQGLFRSGLMARARAGSCGGRVGLAEGGEGAARLYTDRVATGGVGVHAVDRLMRVAGAFGADVREPRFVVPMEDDDRRWAGETLAGVPGPRLVLNVGARWLTKRWPPSRFAEVARRAVAERGAGLIAVGAPEDRQLVDELLACLAPLPCLDLCGRTTPPRLAAVASASECFLSNDTGTPPPRRRGRAQCGRYLHLHRPVADGAAWGVGDRGEELRLVCA